MGLPISAFLKSNTCIAIFLEVAAVPTIFAVPTGGLIKYQTFIPALPPDCDSARVKGISS